MTRQLSGTNVAHINSRHTHPVLMAKLLFSTPVYVHSGLGIITFETNDYLGVGTLGGVAGLEETEALVPAAIVLSLDGLNSDVFDEALNSANYGDKVTLNIAYRNDDGTLIDDPWIFYRGRVENSRLTRGSNNSVAVTIQHELAVLNKRTNTKFTDEEQQRRFTGDTAFKRVEQMETVQLTWGRRDERIGGDRDGIPGPNDPRTQIP